MSRIDFLKIAKSLSATAPSKKNMRKNRPQSVRADFLHVRIFFEGAVALKTAMVKSKLIIIILKKVQFFLFRSANSGRL